MVVFWLRYRLSGKLGYLDSGWTFCVTLAGLSYAMAGPGLFWRRALLTITVLLWGGRLLAHLEGRLAAQQGEERRYRELLEALGRGRAAKLFLLFMFEALLALVLARSFALIAAAGGPWTRYDSLGLGLFIAGWLGVGLADRQLAAFKASQEMGVCQTGLWRYSRHPNYFCEWVLWLGWGIWGLGQGWSALLAPLLMFGLLRYVTGVPPAERSSLQSRPQAYREYQQSTPPFFPFWK